MKYTHMAVGLTPESDEMHAVAVEWNPESLRVKVSLFEHETGQLIVSSAGDVPTFLEPLDGPEEHELSYLVYHFVSDLLPCGLPHQDRARSRVLLAAELYAIRWWPAAQISGSLRSSLEEALAVSQ